VTRDAHIARVGARDFPCGFSFANARAMSKAFMLAVAALAFACSDPATTQSYDGSASYSGATSGASSAHVVVSGLPEFCNYPQGPCIGQTITITTDACLVNATVTSLQEDRADLEGFTASVGAGQSCTLGPETITVQTGTLVSTFATLALDISGTSTTNDFFDWKFTGNGG
jgi:hypothetical protein